MNNAWDRFASENGGAPAALGERVRGTPWLDHVAGERLRQHYAALLLGALEGPRWPGVVIHGVCGPCARAYSADGPVLNGA